MQPYMMLAPILKKPPISVRQTLFGKMARRKKRCVMRERGIGIKILISTGMDFQRFCDPLSMPPEAFKEAELMEKYYIPAIEKLLKE